MALRRELVVLFPFGKGLVESFSPHVETLDEDFWCCGHIPCEGGMQGDFPDFSGPKGPFSDKIIGYGLEWSHWDHRVQFLTLFLPCHR